MEVEISLNFENYSSIFFLTKITLSRERRRALQKFPLPRSHCSTASRLGMCSGTGKIAGNCDKEFHVGWSE